MVGGTAKAVKKVETALSDSVLLELKEPGTPGLCVRRRTLAARVVRQVEFYLSKEHLQHDGYLNELMAENESGWIRLADLLAFPRMKTLCLPQVRVDPTMPVLCLCCACACGPNCAGDVTMTVLCLCCVCDCDCAVTVTVL